MLLAGGAPDEIVAARSVLRGWLLNKANLEVPVVTFRRHSRRTPRSTNIVDLIHGVGIGRDHSTYCLRIYTDASIVETSRALSFVKDHAGDVPMEFRVAPRPLVGCRPQSLNGRPCFPFTPAHRRPYNTIVAGVSIGNSLMQTGTLGYFCRRPQDESIYLLSVGHVLAGERVDQPGPHDCLQLGEYTYHVEFRGRGRICPLTSAFCAVLYCGIVDEAVSTRAERSGSVAA
jgi:hypothetical protein